MKKPLVVLTALILSSFGFSQAREADESWIAAQPPTGTYVLNEASDEQAPSTAYASGLLASSAYQNVIAGHA